MTTALAAVDEKKLNPAEWSALERTRLAYERTLMAWIRTAVALITFGFSIYKFFQYVQQFGPPQPQRFITPRGVGIVMIGAGLFTLFLATAEHWQSLKRLRQQYPGMQMSLATVLAALLSALGFLALFAALFRQ